MCKHKYRMKDKNMITFFYMLMKNITFVSTKQM